MKESDTKRFAKPCTAADRYQQDTDGYQPDLMKRFFQCSLHAAL